MTATTLTTPAGRSTRVTSGHVRAVLEDLVSHAPEHTDRRAADGLPARYLDHGQPNCLVAKALVALGFPVTMLRDMDRERPVGEVLHAGVKIAESRHPGLRRLDPGARALLQFVQDLQDNGHPWGQVVTAAFSPARWRRLDRSRRPWLHS